MKLADIYSLGDEGIDLLWQLLSEREKHQSISHKRMPSWAEHCAFVASRPYEAWYGIDCGELVGSAYLTRAREVGIAILKKHRRNHYAENALRLLIEKHPVRMLANINPANHASIKLFTGLGFNGPIQSTFELTT